MLRYNRYLIIIHFLLCIKGISQPYSIVPRFMTLGVNEGLSQNSVYSIYQDKKGYIWIGTADGLNRYDGAEIRKYIISDNIQYPGNSNKVSSGLLEDEQGNIWYCNETGIFFWNHQSDRIAKALSFDGKGLKSKYFKMVCKWKQKFYLYHLTEGILEYDPGKNQLVKYPLPIVIDYNTLNPSLLTFNAVSDGADKIAVSGGNANGIFLFDLGTKKYTHKYENLHVKNVFFKNDKTYVLLDKKIMIDSAGEDRIAEISLTAVPDLYKAFNIYEDRLAGLWLLTGNRGVARYDKYKKTFTWYTHTSGNPYSLPVDNTTVMFNDRHDNLWIGTEGGGITRLDIKKRKFYQFPLNEGDYPQLNDFMIKSLYETGKDSILFGTATSGLCILNKKTNKLTVFKNIVNDPFSVPGNFVSCIFRDAENNLWTGGTNGIALFREGKFYRVPISNLPRVPYAFVAYKFIQYNKNVLLLASNLGIIRVIRNAAGYAASYIRNQQGADTNDLIADEDGTLWASCPNNGIKKLVFVSDSLVNEEVYFTGIDIRSIHRDELNKKLLWVCSSKGLIRFNTTYKNFYVFNELDGMPGNYVYAVLEDSVHNFWVSTNSGLSYFVKSEYRFENYNSHDGLQSNEFNSGAYFKSASGIFYFGGVKGFNWFQQSNILIDTIHPNIAISDIKVDGVSRLQDSLYLLKNTIRLENNQKTIGIKVSVLDYTFPDANTVYFKLAGSDTDWRNTRNKELYFNNLGPGEYTLLIRGTNSYGISSPVKELHITVLPPFWKTPFFIAVSSVLVIMAVVFITISILRGRYKRRLEVFKRKEALDRERERISREMHDDIGAGLTQIVLMSESLRQKAEKNNGKELQDINDTSRKLIASMSEIIWSMNTETGTVGDLLVYLRENINVLLEYSAINSIIDFPDTFSTNSLSAEQKRNIVLIVKEAVHNAIKHSGAKHISVSAEEKNDELVFSVKDDGAGLDASYTASGNGLKNMKKRAEAINGAVSIDSEKGKGTVITIRIPLKSHSQ